MEVFMPRIKDGIERATKEEIDEMAKQAKSEMKKAKAEAPKELKTEGIGKMTVSVAPVVEVGLTVEKKATPDKAIDDKFKFVPCPKKGWISMSDDEARVYSDRGVLAGYDPANKIGLIKKED